MSSRNKIPFVTIAKRAVFLLVAAMLVFGVRYAWQSLPIITGYSAKMACSCMYLGGRELASVQSQELGGFPLRLASVRKETVDSAVVATVFGVAKQKAIYRAGLGCTLVNELSEEAIRAQPVPQPVLLPADMDTIRWPQGDLLPDTLPRGVDQHQLAAAVHAAFVEKESEKPVRTRAVVVLYDGQLVAEEYAPGFDRHSRQLSWSMAKSVTSALIGILVRQGRLDVHAPPPVPEWRSASDGREQIRLEHLLQQTSGLDFEENYSKATSATNMLFRKADMGRYTAAMPLREKPGSRFYYSSGNSNILSRIMRTVVGDSTYHAFPSRELFSRIGMYSAVIEPDASGTFVGSSYVFATARDWARFGLLYANDGTWMGERILPEGWVKATTQPVPVAPEGEYGYQFWLNAGAAGNPGMRKFPDLPTDLFYADGYEGQYVFIIPSRRLVVVRLGQTPGPWFNAGSFLNGILNALPSP